MKIELQYKRYSEKSILIEWPPKIDENSLRKILLVKKSVEKFYGKLIVEVVFTYNSLLIYYASTIEDFYSEVLSLKSLCNAKFGGVLVKNKLWKIPVCYASSLAMDLDVFTKDKNLSIDEVIALHTSSVYTVYFMGFLPGFLYLGGLHKKLFCDRKITPSPKIEKGAVAIGGNQTGIYPVESPGGWHVIGRCPVDFFDPNKEDCCFVSPGDRIQFVSISEKKYNDISSLFFHGLYTPEFVFE
ncbi:5-oxoprolinase subunit PxpB [Aquimarina sp. 2201CG1-2-11]|uniref:5-oxoprolinase subunit PxpB n=1 Tax=Aquimarina discodermiae TaxID=3231043 RepID=UPI0034621E77